MRRRAVEFDDRAVSFLADKGHMRERNDMAAVHTEEQAGVEMRLGFRDRPRTHPLTDTVMDLGIMCIGPDAADLGGVNKMRAVSALDRQPRRWRGAILRAGTEVKFEVLDPYKRPVSATADSHEVRDVVEVTIHESRDKTVTLLFDPEHNLDDRILNEQFAY